MKVRWADRTPVGWLARVIRVPGRERRAVVQAGKATLAATSAWLVATRALHLPQPFLAPYAAVFLIDATVYRSLRGWVQQVGSVAAGVVLAGVAARLLPWTTVALGVAVGVGLLIGNWRRFGAAGVWVGITAMLLISYGTATNPALLGDRLLETALGAAIGATVNTLIFPPLYGERLVTASRRLTSALAGLLDETAELVRTDEPPDDVESWLGKVRDVRSLISVAEDAIGLTREGRVLNLRRRDDRHDRPLGTLIGLWPAVEHLVDAIRTASAKGEPFGYPWPDARDGLADVLVCIADAIRGVGGLGERVDLDGCRELLDRIDRTLVAPEGGLTATLGLGAMALPVRHLLERLEAAQV